MEALLRKIGVIKEGTSVAIRSISVVTYVACVVLNGLNGLFGPETVSEVSDKFRLWVTPPDLFFSIWGIIYTLVTVVLLVAVWRNSWSTHSHLWFWTVNVLNTLWIYVWCRGTTAAMIPACIIIAALALSLFCLWSSLANQSPDLYLLTRNTFALYFGWVSGATLINFGIVLVYVFKNLSQKQYAHLFFMEASLVGLVITTIIWFKEGGQGIKSSIGLWFALLWAVAGAYISTLNYDKNLFTKGFFEL